MKQNLIVALLIIMLFVLPLLTSILLDWTFIKAEKSRQILVYWLMIVEIIVTLILLLQYLKQLSKQST